MHKLLAAIIILVFIFGLVFILTTQAAPKPAIPTTPAQVVETPEDVMVPTTTDITASFAIFTNGTFRIFTAPMYHNLSEDVFIEASNPNTVQVRKAKTTWDAFFSTLPFKLTSECLTTGTNEIFCSGDTGTLKFYLNGEESDTALEQEIKKGDKLLVTFGTESEEAIIEQINRVP